jgi:hypothetical protein
MALAMARTPRAHAGTDYLTGDSLHLDQASNSHVAQAWYVSQRLRRSHHTAPHCIHLACSTIGSHRTKINVGCSILWIGPGLQVREWTTHSHYC